VNLDAKVELYLVEWALWMRDDKSPQKYQVINMDSCEDFVQKGLPDMPRGVRIAEYAISRLNTDCIEFIKAWFGVDRYRNLINPALWGTHKRAIAARRRAVEGAMKIQRGRRSQLERAAFSQLTQSIPLLEIFI